MPERNIYVVTSSGKTGTTTRRSEAEKFVQKHGGKVYAVPSSFWRGPGAAYGVDLPTIRAQFDPIMSVTAPIVKRKAVRRKARR